MTGNGRSAIVITGATGFVGTRVVPSLSSAGDPVVTCHRRTLPAQLDAVDHALAGMSCTRVRLVHLAGGYRGKRSWPELFADNTGSVSQALDAFGPRLDQVVFLSSVAVYGSPGVPPGPDPGTSYGRAKRLAEQLLGLFRAGAGRPVAILRAASVYGEGNAGTNAVAQLTRSVAQGRPFLLHDRPHGRDYVYVDDVARAVRYALNAGFDGTVDIGTGRSTTPAELAAVAAAGFDVEVRGSPPPHGHAAARFRCDTSAAEQRLGFRTAVALEDGLAREIRWRCRVEEGR